MPIELSQTALREAKSSTNCVLATLWRWVWSDPCWRFTMWGSRWGLATAFDWRRPPLQTCPRRSSVACSTEGVASAGACSAVAHSRYTAYCCYDRCQHWSRKCLSFLLMRPLNFGPESVLWSSTGWFDWFWLFRLLYEESQAAFRNTRFLSVNFSRFHPTHSKHSRVRSRCWYWQPDVFTYGLGEAGLEHLNILLGSLILGNETRNVLTILHLLMLLQLRGNVLVLEGGRYMLACIGAASVVKLWNWQALMLLL